MHCFSECYMINCSYLSLPGTLRRGTMLSFRQGSILAGMLPFWSGQRPVAVGASHLEVPGTCCCCGCLVSGAKQNHAGILS